MKPTSIALFIAVPLTTAFALLGTLRSAEPTGFQQWEYATIRWGGRDNTHFIRPNGQVEMLDPILKELRRPDRTDERAYLMTIALNAVAREGWELVTATPDERFLRRSVPQ
jgi:hypothetical protein